MKIIAGLFFMFVFTGLSFGQTKKTVVKPEPTSVTQTKPIAEEIKPTQKVTIEKLNGDRLTGLFVSGDKDSVTIEISGTKLNVKLSEIAALRFNESKTAAENKPAVEETSLAIEAAIIYKMGGAQPVARTNIYLLDKSLSDILNEAGLKPEKNFDLVTTFGLARLYPGQYAAFNNADTAIKTHILGQTTTDFTGKAEMKGIATGKYFVYCFSQTRKGFAIWNLPIEINGGINKLVLDQNNAVAAL